MKYTIENWKTGQIQVKNISNKVFNRKIKEIIPTLSKYNCKFLNIIEMIFVLVFESEGWKIIRLPLRKKDPILMYVEIMLTKELAIKDDSLFGKGCPDLLLYDLERKKFRFVEIKQTEKSLNKNQIDWIKKYNYEVYVVKLAPLHDGHGNKINNKFIKRFNKLKH